MRSEGHRHEQAIRDECASPQCSTRRGIIGRCDGRGNVHNKLVNGFPKGKSDHVITLDKNKKPLGTCTERRARIGMEKGRACVYRYFPFTGIVKDMDVRKMGNLPAYRRDHARDSFTLAADFPGATHNIFEQMPVKVADVIKKFIEET